MGARRIIHTVMARGCRRNSLLPRRRCLTGRFLDNPAKQSLASLTLFNSVMAYQGRGCGTKAAYPQSSAGNEVSGTRPDRRRRACWHQAARFVTSPRAPSIAFSRASVAQCHTFGADQGDIGDPEERKWRAGSSPGAPTPRPGVPGREKPAAPLRRKGRRSDGLRCRP
jgi:hypothetical protein